MTKGIPLAVSCTNGYRFPGAVVSGRMGASAHAMVSPKKTPLSKTQSIFRPKDFMAFVLRDMDGMDFMV